jgi:hypothetical protein
MDNEVAARATSGAGEELIDSTQLARTAGQSHGLRYTSGNNLDRWRRRVESGAPPQPCTWLRGARRRRDCRCRDQRMPRSSRTLDDSSVAARGMLIAAIDWLVSLGRMLVLLDDLHWTEETSLEAAARWRVA